MWFNPPNKQKNKQSIIFQENSCTYICINFNSIYEPSNPIKRCAIVHAINAHIYQQNKYMFSII